MKYAVLNSVLTGLLILICNAALAGNIMTLDQCLEIGEKNNPTLMATRYDLEGAGYDIKAARADFLPSLSSGYSISELISDRSKGPTETDYLDQTINSFNIKLTQILYAGSRIVNTFDKSKLTESLVKARMALKRLELSYQIETTFFRLMKAEQDVIAMTESVSRLTESIKSAEAFFEKELVPYVEVLQARVDLADARERLEIARNNQNRERVTLFALMNLPVDSDVVFQDSLSGIPQTDPSFVDSFQYALENRPDIKALQYQIEMAGKEEKIAMGKYLPMVRADVGYFINDRDYQELGQTGTGFYDRDQTNQYWSAGIYVSWEMFDGGRAWYGREKHRTEARKYRELIKEAENTIDTGIRKALLSLEEAKQRMITSAETLAAANEYYSQEASRLNAGISTIPALLDAQDRLIRAQGNKTRAVLDYQLAKSELKYMTGGLVF